MPLLDDMLGYYRPALFVLLGAVALLLSRRASTSRACCWRGRPRGRARWPCAPRSARRARGCVRQMLVESVLLATAGTAAGALGALAAC